MKIMNEPAWKCPHCGSEEGTWFSRTLPMGNFCESCGRCCDAGCDSAGEPLTTPIETTLTPRTDAFIKEAVFDSQMVEYARQLERELNEVTTQLHAWHETFGTNQLTHALARLESAETENSRLKEILAMQHFDKNKRSLRDARRSKSNQPQRLNHEKM